MREHERQDHINEAKALLACVQSLLCETRHKDVTLEADGLSVLLNCVVNKLDAASIQ